MLTFMLGLSGLALAFGLRGVEAQEVSMQPEPAAQVVQKAGRISTAEENSLLAVCENSFTWQPATTTDAIAPVKKMEVVATAYSSTPEETDDTPFTTASGATVKDGVVANNLFPFGTKIKIPQLYGDKIFTVEDRMHWSKRGYHIDIWFPDTAEALSFGVKNTYIEILN